MKRYSVIYWYTTSLNKSQHQVKNGSAQREANSPYEVAKIRIKEQVTPANSADNYEILHVEDVTDHCTSLGHLRKLEKYLHKKQKLLGMWVQARSNKAEWFHDLNKQSVDNVVDIGVRLLNDKIFSSKNKNTFLPHQSQQSAINKAIRYFINGGTDFLLDAVMRFGKCFAAYYIAKQLGVKRILIITGRPKVINGWEDDLDHVEFNNWEFIDSTKTKQVKFNDGTKLFEPIVKSDVEVIFASFQGSKKDLGRLDLVKDQQIDLVIIDEAHAYFSKAAIEFIYALNTNRRLWISGTPFNAYESGMFDGTTDTFRFTLLDLLREKKRVDSSLKAGKPVSSYDKHYAKFPNVQFLVAGYPTFANTKLYNEEKLNMKALLSSTNDVPNYPKDVITLLDSFSDPNKRGPFNYSSREVTGITAMNPRHIWLTVPAGKDDKNGVSVAAANTLTKMIGKHSLGKEYKPFPIKGDKTEDDVNQHIAESKYDNKGTINISCRSLTTGTKFPDIDTIIFLTETSSAAEFWQTIGRGLQPKSGKECITIICESVEMVINMMSRMVEYSIKDRQDYDTIMQEFLSMAPIVRPGHKPMNLSEVYTTLTKSGSINKIFGDRSLLVNKKFIKCLAKNPNFFGTIPDVNSSKGPSSKAINGAGKKGKNAKSTKSTNKGKTKTPAEIQKEYEDKIRNRVMEFLKLFGSIMTSSVIYDGLLIESHKDITNINKETIDNELYSGTKSIICKLIKDGVIDTNILDRKISAFYHICLKDRITEGT